MPAESTALPRVLVAEDEPAMLSLVARHLRNLGCSVLEAADGDSAWALAQEHRPDLVVLDVMMPGMSGWEICKRLKAESSEGRPFAKTGVIMLTGIGETLNDMTSRLFAADASLNKPFDFAELDALVRETLKRYGGPAPDAARRAEAREVPPGRSSEPKASALYGGPARKRGASPAKNAAATKATNARAGSAADGAARKAAKKAAPSARAKKASSPALAKKKSSTKAATATSSKKPSRAAAAKEPATKKAARCGAGSRPK